MTHNHVQCACYCYLDTISERFAPDAHPAFSGLVDEHNQFFYFDPNKFDGEEKSGGYIGPFWDCYSAYDAAKAAAEKADVAMPGDKKNKPEPEPEPAFEPRTEEQFLRVKAAIKTAALALDYESELAAAKADPKTVKVALERNRELQYDYDYELAAAKADPSRPLTRLLEVTRERFKDLPPKELAAIELLEVIDRVNNEVEAFLELDYEAPDPGALQRLSNTFAAAAQATAAYFSKVAN